MSSDIQGTRTITPPPPISIEDAYKLARQVLALDLEPLISGDARHDHRTHDERHGMHDRFCYRLRFTDCVVELIISAWNRAIGPDRLTRTVDSLVITFGPENNPQVYRRLKSDTLRRINCLLSPS